MKEPNDQRTDTENRHFKHYIQILQSLLSYTRVGNVCPGWPFYGVKDGRNEGGRGATPTSNAVFDSYDMKTL